MSTDDVRDDGPAQQPEQQPPPLPQPPALPPHEAPPSPGYPPQGPPAAPAYPPPQGPGGYPPPQAPGYPQPQTPGGYPPPQGPGYPQPQGPGGYPPPQGPGYPQPQGPGGYPPPGGPGYPPPGAGGYPPPQGAASYPPPGTPYGAPPAGRKGLSTGAVLGIVGGGLVLVLVAVVAFVVGGRGGDSAVSPGSTASGTAAGVANVPASPSAISTVAGTCDAEGVAKVLRGRAAAAGRTGISIEAGPLPCPATEIGIRSVQYPVVPDPAQLASLAPTVAEGTYSTASGLDVTPSAPPPCTVVVVYSDDPVPAAASTLVSDLQAPVLKWLPRARPALGGDAKVYTAAGDSPIIAVVTGRVSGDCDLDPSVDAPSARRGDCWMHGKDEGSYKKVGCTAKHSSEVLYVRTYGLRAWRSAHKGKADPSQAAYRKWMRGQAEQTCGSRFRSVPLRRGVSIGLLRGSLIYPSAYSPYVALLKGSKDTSQIVCLITFKDDRRTTARKMLAV